MEIWVRSQDGNILTKVDGVYIKERCSMQPISSEIHYIHKFDLIGMRDDTRITLCTFDKESDAQNILEAFVKHVIDMENNCAIYKIFQIPEDKHV